MRFRSWPQKPIRSSCLQLTSPEIIKSGPETRCLQYEISELLIAGLAFTISPSQLNGSITPTPNVPRTPDGKPNFAVRGFTPRTRREARFVRALGTGTEGPYW